MDKFGLSTEGLVKPLLLGLLLMALPLPFGYLVGRKILGEYGGPWIFLSIFGLYVIIAVVGLVALFAACAWGIGSCILGIWQQ